jgi:hypothetical protein
VSRSSYHGNTGRDRATYLRLLCIYINKYRNIEGSLEHRDKSTRGVLKQETYLRGLPTEVQVRKKCESEGRCGVKNNERRAYVPRTSLVPSYEEKKICQEV